MISKGDLVKMRLSTGGGGTGKSTLKDMLILGKVMNYCEEEDNFVIETKVISVPKDQVMEIEPLPPDFDFDEVSVEIGQVERNIGSEKPPEINEVRFSR